MPNILQLAKELEGVSDDRLMQEANSPNVFPPHLTLAEILRREKARAAYRSRLQQMPQGTVRDQLISRALSGIGSIPQQQQTQPMPAAMAMAQGGPPMDPSMMQGGMPPQGGMPMQMPMGAMAEGGIVGYSDGGRIPGYQDGGQPQVTTLPLDPNDEINFVQLPMGPDDDPSFVELDDEEAGLFDDVPGLNWFGEFAPLVAVGAGDILLNAAFRGRGGSVKRAAEAYRRSRRARAAGNASRADRLRGIALAEARRAAPSGRTLLYGGLGLPPVVGGIASLFGERGDVDDDFLVDVGGAYGSPGSTNYAGLGGGTISEIRDMIQQSREPLESETKLADLMGQRENLLTQNRNRLTALDQRRIDFEEEQGRQMQELIDARRSRIEGRIDPEQDERDRLAMLAGVVGGAISRGRFQEGGIGGGIAAGVPSLLDLRSQQRDRTEGIEDSLDDLTLGALQQVKDTRTAIDGIRREMLTGNMSDEEARFAIQLEVAKLNTEIERRNIDPTALLQLATIEGRLAEAQLNSSARDRLSVSDVNDIRDAIEKITETDARDDRTPQQIFDQGMSLVDRLVESGAITSSAGSGYRLEIVNRMKQSFPNIEFAAGQDEEAGYSDGGMVGTGFDKLIPQP